MEHNVSEKLHRINNLLAETDAVYHQASLRLGIADSTMRILYTILDNGERCLLSDVYKQSGISKQTVNSALRKLESAEIIRVKSMGVKGTYIRIINPYLSDVLAEDDKDADYSKTGFSLRELGDPV